MQTDNQVLILGETNFRNTRERFGIKPDDRRRHMYVVGSTGMGKSEFLKKYGHSRYRRRPRLSFP